METNHRLISARQDLQTQITDVFPSPGTLLIIHPKGEVQFAPEYAEWLGDTLKTILPRGVKAMVLAENVSNFDLITPADEGFDYMRGWNDAIKAISELNP